MAIDLRPFEPFDIPFALEQTRREGWDSTSVLFELCLGHDPGGAFVAEVGARPAGMVTTTRYARTAWIGNLIVTPGERRQGIGRRLMERAIAHLTSSGIETIRLEADPDGVHLYRSLGFTDELESLRFLRAPVFPNHDAVHRLADASSDPAISSLTQRELPAVAAFDAPIFGEDRGQLLAGLLASCQGGYVLRRNGKVEAYALLVPSRLGVRIGPAAATAPDAARTLLTFVFADRARDTLIAGVPAPAAAAVAIYTTAGFVRTPSSARMVRGPRQSGGRLDATLAIANGAMG